MDDALDKNTRELAALLEGREGWRFGAFEGGENGPFGVNDAERIVITPRSTGFQIYQAGTDDGWTAADIGQVQAWLDEHEHEPPPRR